MTSTLYDLIADATAAGYAHEDRSPESFRLYIPNTDEDYRVEVEDGEFVAATAPSLDDPAPVAEDIETLRGWMGLHAAETKAA